MTPRTRSQTRSSRKRNISDDSMYSETTASDVDNSDSDAESVVERVPKTRRVSRAQYIEQESDQDTDMEDFSTEDEEQEVDASSGAMKEDDATEEGSETSEKADDDEEEEGEDEYFTPDESEEYNDGEEDEEYGDLPEGRRRQLGYDARRSKVIFMASDEFYISHNKLIKHTCRPSIHMSVRTRIVVEFTVILSVFTLTRGTSIHSNWQVENFQY